MKKLIVQLESKENVFYAFAHTLLLIVLLYITGIVPFINPRTDSPVLKSMRYLSPLLQSAVLLLGIRIMGALSTKHITIGEKDGRKEYIEKQIIGPKDFRIIVIMSAVFAVIIGFGIMIYTGDNSGTSVQLIINIIAVTLGIMVSPDEVFAGKDKWKTQSEDTSHLLNNSTKYDTLSSSLCAAILIIIILLFYSKQGEECLYSFWPNFVLVVISFGALFVAYLISLYQDK